MRNSNQRPDDHDPCDLAIERRSTPRAGRSALLSALLLCACQSPVVLSGLPEETPLNTLSEGDSKSACDNIDAYHDNALDEGERWRLRCMFGSMIVGGACEEYSQCEATPQDIDDPDLADLADYQGAEEALECNLNQEIECTATIEEYEACIVENTQRLEKLLSEFTCFDETASAEEYEAHRELMRLAFKVGPECTSLGMKCGVGILPNHPIPFEI